MRSSLRYWLIDLPARAAEWILAAYRVYMLVLLVVAGPGLVLMVLTTLVLWFAFGIRWGW